MRIIVILIFLHILSVAFAQKAGSKYDIIQQRIEAIAEDNQSEDIDLTTIFDRLNYYYNHPLNINSANREDLEQFYLLNDIQINNLLNHIKKTGKLLNIYELQSIEGFDINTIKKILPFVIVKREIETPHISLKDIFANGENFLFLRYQRVLEEQKGYSPIDDSILALNPNKRYLGSADKIYARYKFNYGYKLAFGITGEKDAGEEFFKGSQKNGFDFYSAHFFLRNFGFLKALAIGDYQIEIGQGLTIWSSLAFNKTPDVINIKRNAVGIRPYTSVDENRFLRGAATTIKIKKFEITTFGSKKKIDAKISSIDTIKSANSDIEIVTTVSSLQQTGYHRTVSEVEDKDAIDELFYGSDISFKSNNLSIGFSASHSELSGNLVRDLKVYNQFEFSSNSNTLFGAHYNFVLHNFNFFGEFAQSYNGGKAYINGILAALDKNFSIALMHRNYERNFQSLYSNAFGENTKNANEKGIYLGAEIKFKYGFKLSSYFDNFSFPWLKYQVNSPTNGYDYLSQLNYTPNEKINVYLRYRHKEKGKNTSLSSVAIDFPVIEKRSNYRFNISYKVSKSITLRSRIEYIQYKLGEEKNDDGYLFYEDLIFKPLNFPLHITLRYALFDTDTYDSRVYAYENDLLYVFSIPAYYYKGSRAYLMLRYKIARGIDIWLRWSQTFYENRNVIGSGLNQINGNTKTELKAMLRLKF